MFNYNDRNINVVLPDEIINRLNPLNYKINRKKDIYYELKNNTQNLKRYNLLKKTFDNKSISNYQNKKTDKPFDNKSISKYKNKRTDKNKKSISNKKNERMNKTFDKNIFSSNY